MDIDYVYGQKFVSIEDHVERTVHDLEKYFPYFPVLREIDADLREILQTACEDLAEKVFPGYIESGKQGNLDGVDLNALEKEVVAFVQRSVLQVSVVKNKPLAKDVAGDEMFLMFVDSMASSLFFGVCMSKKPDQEDDKPASSSRRLDQSLDDRLKDNPYWPPNIDIHKVADGTIDQIEMFRPELKHVDSIIRPAFHDAMEEAYEAGLASKTVSSAVNGNDGDVEVEGLLGAYARLVNRAVDSNPYIGAKEVLLDNTIMRFLRGAFILAYNKGEVVGTEKGIALGKLEALSKSDDEPASSSRSIRSDNSEDDWERWLSGDAEGDGSSDSDSFGEGEEDNGPEDTETNEPLLGSVDIDSDVDSDETTADSNFDDIKKWYSKL
jgi:hypothetical protein